jgi:hypothetical protein
LLVSSNVAAPSTLRASPRPLCAHRRVNYK